MDICTCNRPLSCEWFEQEHRRKHPKDVEQCLDGPKSEETLVEARSDTYVCPCLCLCLSFFFLHVFLVVCVVSVKWRCVELCLCCEVVLCLCVFCVCFLESA